MHDRSKLYMWVKILKGMTGELPHGIEIHPDFETNNILVSNDKLGFCITARAMEEGLYKTGFGPALDQLVVCLDNKEIWPTQILPTGLLKDPQGFNARQYLENNRPKTQDVDNGKT